MDKINLADAYLHDLSDDLVRMEKTLKELKEYSELIQGDRVNFKQLTDTGAYVRLLRSNLLSLLADARCGSKNAAHLRGFEIRVTHTRT